MRLHLGAKIYQPGLNHYEGYTVGGDTIITCAAQTPCALSLNCRLETWLLEEGVEVSFGARVLRLHGNLTAEAQDEAINGGGPQPKAADESSLSSGAAPQQPSLMVAARRRPQSEEAGAASEGRRRSDGSLDGSLSSGAAWQQPPLMVAARRIVISTPIAESSLTIDGIGVVVDSGYRKSPIFNVRTGEGQYGCQYALFCMSG